MSLKEEFIKLVKEDEFFRITLKSYFEDNFATKNDIKTLLAQIKQLREDYQSEMKNQREEFQKEIKNQREEFQKEMKNQREEFQKEMKNQREEFQKEMKNQREDLYKLFEKVDLKLGALGARWGLMSEQATRNGLKEIFKNKMQVDVSTWTSYDEKGIVFGIPSRVEIDIVIKNGEHWLIEYKASIQRSDVAELVRKGTLYQEKEKQSPKLFIISPFIDPRAKGLADNLNVIIYSVD